ncbi:hypothetical protein FUSO6_07960 [Fusobacterium necrophorum DAB]|uniref:histidine phosphatase family protein n=1 Tax=Fusobacterium necrophorum TaxID=859 RepID=UPI000460FEFC|nr:histidine phosphatase family protein [Fusobacterium necrophorum]KDE68821.1 hypothetical protein FUSO6_07960 [Fusobacterium necrophorum DAB]
MVYFIRHGQTDYSERNTKIYQGFGVNLAKLSESGIAQVKEAAKDERLKGADIILSSPYTRAVQTASILSKELDIDIAIETDLHEWLENKNYIHENDEVTENSYLEYEKTHGKYPLGKEKLWEDAASIKKRVLKVLNKYCDYERVIVACHGVMIQATTGKEFPEYAEILEFDLEKNSLMNLPFEATETDLKNCILILRDITGKQDVNELAIRILNIIGAKGGDYSVNTIRAFAEAYLKESRKNIVSE